MMATTFPFYTQQNYTSQDTERILSIKSEFENCTFTGCDFSRANLSGYQFTACKFTACNLSLAMLQKTLFHEVVFNECKLSGLQFGQCNPFGLAFSVNHSIMDHASLPGLNCKNFKFSDSRLHQVDFTGCNLNQASFHNCDLLGAVFDRTNLEKADFTTAFHLNIDPEINKMKGARFSAKSLPGLLAKYRIRIDE